MKRLLSLNLVALLIIPGALRASEEEQKTSAASMLQLQKHAARDAQERERKQEIESDALVGVRQEEQVADFATQQKNFDTFAYCLLGHRTAKHKFGLPDVLVNLVAQYSGLLPDSEYTLERTLKGHTANVASSAFNRNGSQVVSAGDRTVKVWSVDTGDCLLTMTGHTDLVLSATFNHDSSQIVSASVDKTIKVWSVDTGDCLRTLTGHESCVNSVAFNHDGSRIVSTSNDGTVKLWNAHTGDCLLTMEDHTDWVNSAAFNHDGSRIVSAGDDGLVKVWDTHTGICLRSFEGHHYSVNSAAFNHDGSLIVSTSYGTVKVWDAHTGICLRSLTGHSDLVRSVTFNHDSSQIVSASTDKTIKVWNAHTGDCLFTLTNHSGPVTSVTLSNDDFMIASASWDKTIKIWKIKPTLHDLIKPAQKAHDARLNYEWVRRVLDADPDQVDAIIAQREKRKKRPRHHSAKSLEDNLAVALKISCRRDDA